MQSVEAPLRPLQLEGRTFGYLTVIRRHGSDKRGQSTFECACECGEKAVVRGKSLVNGDTRSCGCAWKSLIGKGRAIHGMSDSREFRIWSGMIDRCYRAKSAAYRKYGARGIFVCDRWRAGRGEGFSNFLADMGPAPDGMSLDRKNNDGPYSPENCRWADPKTQARNSRNTRLVTYRGITAPISEICELFGADYSNTISRLRYGWTIDRAIEEKKRFLRPRAR